MGISRVVVTMVCSLLAVAGASAQSIFGGIAGTVKDPVQSAVASAHVILTDSDDGQQHQATTDENGAFDFVNLKPSHYEIVVTMPGFADYKLSNVLLEARQTFRADIMLKLASSAQTIEVAGDAGPH